MMGMRIVSVLYAMVSILLCNKLMSTVGEESTVITMMVSDTSTSPDIQPLPDVHIMDEDSITQLTLPTSIGDSSTSSAFRYEYYKGFDLAFPKAVDQFVASYCTEDFCIYPGIIAGWFWNLDWKREDISFEVRVTSKLLGFQHVIDDAKAMISPEGYLGLEFNFVMQLPRNYVVMDLLITLYNSRNEVVFESMSHVTLMHRSDVFLPNYLDQFQVFVKAQGLGTHAFPSEQVTPSGQSTPITSTAAKQAILEGIPKLDFLEIGTSDFSTALQQSERVKDLFQKKVYGISMEPMLQYQSNLPNVDGVFKLNAAIDVNTSIGDIQHVYYLPATILHLIQNKFIRGCSQIGGIHPYSMRVATRSKVPAFVFQKAAVKTFRVQELWGDFILPHFAGLALLKIDIEGMDQMIVQESIDYLAMLSGRHVVTRHWPCVIYFETNEWSGYRNQEVMSSLKEAGYYLLHEVGAADASQLQEFRKLQGNTSLDVGVEKTETFAFHCQCSSEDYQVAVELIHPSVVNSEFIRYICNSRLGTS